MDNIFELLVILFLIFSAFSSILSKKKKQRKEMEKKTSSPVPSSKKSKDIFEELFGLKFPEENEETIETVSYKTEEENTWDPESEFLGGTKPSQPKTRQIEKKSSKIESQYKPSWQQVNYDKLTRSEIKELDKETTLKEFSKTKVSVNKKALEIKTKLNSPTTIREYILISEILNKPKALRR
ncbi:MAG: hypothetical protein PVH88_14230 [Ignavibacteria bacterium]|jgi:hypothetical protein